MGFEEIFVALANLAGIVVIVVSASLVSSVVQGVSRDYVSLDRTRCASTEKSRVGRFLDLNFRYQNLLALFFFLNLDDDDGQRK